MPRADELILLQEYEEAKQAYEGHRAPWLFDAEGTPYQDAIQWAANLQLAEIRFSEARADLESYVRAVGEVETDRGYWGIGSDDKLRFVVIPEWEALACSA